MTLLTRMFTRSSAFFQRRKARASAFKANQVTQAHADKAKLIVPEIRDWLAKFPPGSFVSTCEQFALWHLLEMERRKEGK